MMNAKFRLAALGVLTALVAAGCSSNSKDETPLATYTVTVTATAVGNASGTIVSSPAGIDCTTGQTCLGEFTEGTTVTLSAVADAGSRFFQWGGACSSSTGNACDLDIQNSDLTVTATFAANQEIGDTFVITSSNQLVSFLRATPESVRSTVQVTGLGDGENLIAIDFQPAATPVLYALSSAGALYTIDHTETDPVVAASRITQTNGSDLTVSIAAGVGYGLDFDAADGLLHIVGSDGTHRTVDASAPGAATDRTAISGAAVSGVAFSHNFPDAPDSVMFGLDASSDNLVVIDPVTGAARAAKALGRDLTVNSGFDIIGTNLEAYVASNEGAAKRFFRLDLTTGTATLVGSLFINGNVQGLAVIPEAGNAAHLDTIALNSSGQLFSFAQATPGTLINRTAVVGLATGDSLVAADFRPVDGQLYGLGLLGNIYSIDAYTGLAGPAVALNGGGFGGLQGTSFGFAIEPTDTDPVVDGGVVVSSGGQLIQISDLDAGTVSASRSLTRGGNAAQATDVAYTNAFFKAQTSTDFVIDSNTDVLATINAATGAMTNVGPLNVNIAGSDAFYIDPRNGAALGAFRVNSETRLYGINLATGAALDRGLIGSDGSELILAMGKVPPAEPLIYALMSDGSIISIKPSDPTTAVATLTITGLGAGEQLVALDYRVSDGRLTGMTGNGRVYLINAETGAASNMQIMTASLNDPSPFVALQGAAFAASFDPTKPNQAASFRVVSDSNENLRVDVASGETFSDANLSFTGTVPSGNPCDTNGSLDVKAMSYTNRFVSAASAQQFVIDLTDGTTLPPGDPVNCIYELTGVERNVLSVVDAVSASGTNAAFANEGSATGLTITGGQNGAVYLAASDGGQSALFSLNIGDGTAVDLGLIGSDASLSVVDLTVFLPVRE